VYIAFIKTPFIKRYVQKIRRRLEILNIDDEYATRRDTAKIFLSEHDEFYKEIYDLVLESRNKKLD
jgi:hypothetical protein